jgi:hypothetical protein
MPFHAILFGYMLIRVSKTDWAPVAFFAATPSYQPSTRSKGEASAASSDRLQPAVTAAGCGQLSKSQIPNPKFQTVNRNIEFVFTSSQCTVLG